MSVISLLNEQLKTTLNKTTKELIISMSDQFNLPYKELLNIWNEINPSFKHNFERKVTIEDFDEVQVVIEDEEVIINHKVVIEDEEVIINHKVVIEDEEVIIVKKPRVTIED